MSESTATPSVLASLSDDLANAVETASAGVVTVYGRQRMPATGIVWTASGLIVSANHVVEKEDDIHIDLPDGRHVGSSIVGRDPNTDLVLLSIDGEQLTPAPRATHEPKVGQLVLAVGRPGKSGPMASLGVIGMVGGRNANDPRSKHLGRFLKTDAAMLPGFSGGPLVDAWGDVLGLNSSTMGRGSGFTLPNEVIDRVVTSLQQHGKVRRGFLGVSAQAVAVNDQMSASLDLPSKRALVIVGLESGGPAEQQGLLIGDIIVRVGGAPVGSVDQLMEQLSGDVVGQPIEIEVIRGGELTVRSIVAGERA
ncbi:MAG: trypsin-like peptidase domain-containing protein [Thermomicrobiales bacterium]|nr:trypsin-like peptidase domain-containing protein [Thermomicrobiales bacterium]